MKLSKLLDFCVVDSNGADYDGTAYVSGHLIEEDGEYYFDDIEIKEIKLTALTDGAVDVACDSLATMPDQFKQIDLNEVERELGDLLLESSGVLEGLSDGQTPIFYSKRLEEQRLALPHNHPDLPY